MGMTFTTVHIHKAQNLTKAQFKKAFTDIMKAKGYTASDEENAALTYTLVFAPDRKWITILTDGTDTRREAAELANGLKAYAVMIDLVDSDFAELSLFDEAGAHKDTLTLGDSYLEDAAPMGDPAAWQPLLCGSWEQVQEIQKGSYTFAEDALARFAPLIGMDSKDILLDNDSAVNDNNAVVLYFKKAEEKKLSVNSAFIKVFGEAFEPMGFIKIKSRYPYYVRSVGNGIIHVISYYQNTSFQPTIKEYVIVGGAASVYRKKIDLSIPPKRNLDWLISNVKVYDSINLYNVDYEFRKRIFNFSCDTEDQRSMIDSFNYSLNVTKALLLSALNQIINIDSFIRYLHGMNLKTSYIEKGTEYFDENRIKYSDEGMIYYFSENYLKLIEEKLEHLLSAYKKQLNNNVPGFTEEEYNARVKRKEQLMKEREENYNLVKNDTELYEKIIDEGNIRCKTNVRYLNAMGIKI